MQIIPLSRVFGLVAASLSAQLWLTTAHAHIVVQVRGSAQLDADVGPSSDGTGLTVRGRLRDELGAAIAAAKLRFEIGETPQPSTSPNTRNCFGQSSTVAYQGGTAIETDDEGRFCAQLPRDQLPNGTALRVVFDGTEAYANTTSAITLGDQRSGLLVDFGQLSHVVRLDEDELSFVTELRPIAPAALQESPPLSLELSLRSSDNGKPEDRQLHLIHAGVGTPTRVTVPSAQLGRPGLADLVLGFDGNPRYKPFRSLYRIERTTPVRLAISDWPHSAIAGDHLAVTVRAESGARLPPPGVVEFVGFDGKPLLFPLQSDGSAQVGVQTPRNPKSYFVSVRYQANTPGWRGDEPLRLALQLSPPSRWNLVSWIGAALLVLAWFAWSRRRAEPGAATASPVITPRPYARLEIIASATDPNAGWSGVVVDAHEGIAIGDATVELHRPGFDRQELLFTALCDQAGQFQIPPQPLESGILCRLEVRASGHARLGLALPPPGRVKVHLVSVRRAILERLISWTRRRGRPFDAKIEPTPDWVAEVARAKGHPEIEAWARAVSSAAFGQEVPVSPESPSLLPPSGGIGARAEAKRVD